MSGGPEEVEATLCDLCNKVHIGTTCGQDLLEGDENFILEFEKLPPDEHINKLRKTIQQLRDDRWRATEKAENYKRRLLSVQHVLPSVREELGKQKFAFGRLKTHTEQLMRLVQTEVKGVGGRAEEAARRLASRDKCDGSCVHVRAELKELQADHASLQTLSKSRQERIGALEVTLQEKSREVEELTVHSKHRDMSSDNKLIKIQKDNAQMEADLKTLRKDLIVMQHHLEEEQANLEATQRQIQGLEGTIESLNGDVSSAHHETEMVRNEKDDLEAKVKAMELELQNTNAGVKERVEQEMLKMMQEMDQYQVVMEKRLQQDVDKEKLKAQKELEEYITEYRDNETKMMKSMRQTGERYKETISELERQIEELTQQTDQREKLLNTELAQLNKRLKRAEWIGRKSTTPVSDQVMQEREERVMELTAQVDQLKQQVSELEQLVQKEVEERNQLMEEYGQVKEELMYYKLQSLGKSSPDPATNSSLPLNIFRKRTVDKYSHYKPSESSGYDMSEFARSAHSYRSLYDAQTQSGAKSSKSIRSQHQETNSLAGPKPSKSLHSSHAQEGQSTGLKSSKSVRSVQSILSQAGNRSTHTVQSIQDILGSSTSHPQRDGSLAPKSSRSRKSLVVDDSAINNPVYAREDPTGTLRKYSSLQQLSVIGGEEAEHDNPLPPVEQQQPIRQSLIQHLASTTHMARQPDKPLPPLDKYSVRQKSTADTFERLSQPSMKEDKSSQGSNSSPTRQGGYNIPNPPRGHGQSKLANGDRMAPADNSPSINHQTGKLHKDRIPPLPKKKSDFSWQVYNNNNHPEESSAYVPMIPLPTKKPKTNWHPSFETIASKNSTPSLYGATPTHDHHPLHGPSSESLHNMTNLSRHSDPIKLPNGQGYREKNGVELPRTGMVKGVNGNNRNLTGTATNSAWKIYRNLKVGNKYP